MVAVFEDLVVCRPDTEHRQKSFLLSSLLLQFSCRAYTLLSHQFLQVAKAKGLRRHLDGARLFNAMVASGYSFAPPCVDTHAAASNCTASTQENGHGEDRGYTGDAYT